MTLVRKLFIALCVAGALPLVFTRPASAWLCVDFGEVMRSSTSVFTGTVVMVRPPKRTGLEPLDVAPVIATLSVDTVWTGEVGREVTIPLQWFAGPLPMLGERYTVAVIKGEAVNNCSMWPASQKHVRDALARTFDEPTQRYDAEQSASGGRPLIPTVFLGGIATLALGIGVVWGLRRRRSRGVTVGACSDSPHGGE